MTKSDRTVHAETPLTRVVRYDRQGSWHLEDKTALREHFGARYSIRFIVEWVTTQPQSRVTYHFGRPGGRTFDKWVQDALVKLEGRS